MEIRFKYPVVPDGVEIIFHTRALGLEAQAADIKDTAKKLKALFLDSLGRVKFNI